MQAGQTTRKGLETRLRALDAAEELFAERGLHGTSVRDLAAALDMPPASLLHHFPRKQTLYRAVLERIAADLDRALARPLGGPGDHRARLRRLCRALADWSHATPRRSNLLLRELLDNPARISAAPVLPLAPVVERVSAFLRQGQAAGAFRPVDPLLALTHMAGSVAYFVAAAPTFVRMTRRRSAAALYRAYRADLIALVEAWLCPPAAGADHPSAPGTEP